MHSLFCRVWEGRQPKATYNTEQYTKGSQSLDLVVAVVSSVHFTRKWKSTLQGLQPMHPQYNNYNIIIITLICVADCEASGGPAGYENWWGAYGR